MRGRNFGQRAMVCYVSLELRVAVGHPLRTIRRFAVSCLRGFGGEP